jgi:phenylpropionate dioxygenase-like ring-hydroxylating dioxygenase large terminal subunit
MKTWHPSVLRHWFAVARADRLKNKPLAVTVLDTPLVIARLPGGDIVALEDRCPHRQVPLSAGRIVRQGIQCPYHGWTFGADGRCVAMPGLPPQECVPNVGARRVAVLQVDGLIWVRLSAEGQAAPPSMVNEASVGTRRFLWQTRWGAYVVDAIENFLDPLHTHLVHPGLVRRNGHRDAVRVRLVTTDEGFMVDYQGQARQSGLLYRLFESPRASECAHFAGAGSACIEYRYLNGSVVRISLHFTPETVERTHVFTTLHVENRWAPAWAVRAFVWPFLKKVATQDQRILELQAANMKRFPKTRGVSTRLDLVREHLERIWEPAELPKPVDAGRDMTVFL